VLYHEGQAEEGPQHHHAGQADQEHAGLGCPQGDVQGSGMAHSMPKSIKQCMENVGPHGQMLVLYVFFFMTLYCHFMHFLWFPFRLFYSKKNL